MVSPQDTVVIGCDPQDFTQGSDTRYQSFKTLGCFDRYSLSADLYII
jgi:hypothetical protein